MLNDCFDGLKDIYKGERCILFGSGPSLKDYTPIDGVKIGCNELVHHEELMDYYFIGDAGSKHRGYKSDPKTYNEYIPTCGYKFIRATPPKHVPKVPAGIMNSKYYSTTDIICSPAKVKLDGFDGDITKRMFDTASISFEALQFAVFTGVSEIVLVGHDCSYSNGTFKTNTVVNSAGGLILKMWYVWEEYVRTVHNIKISVMNPVALDFKS